MIFGGSERQYVLIRNEHSSWEHLGQEELLEIESA